jgi:hypothetical protein
MPYGFPAAHRSTQAAVHDGSMGERMGCSGRRWGSPGVTKAARTDTRRPTPCMGGKLGMRSAPCTNGLDVPIGARPHAGDNATAFWRVRAMTDVRHRLLRFAAHRDRRIVGTGLSRHA